MTKSRKHQPRKANMDGAPEGFKGLRVGYHMLEFCMQRTDHLVALVPWFTITDSDVRLRALHDFGLISVTGLPRSTFQYTRIQTIVLELQRGYTGKTIFKVYERLHQAPAMKCQHRGIHNTPCIYTPNK